MAADTYRSRFRFRLLKSLNIENPEHRVTVAGREVVLTSDIHGKAIRDSDWLVMNARGFESEQAARDFATKIKTCLAHAVLRPDPTRCSLLCACEADGHGDSLSLRPSPSAL